MLLKNLTLQTATAGRPEPTNAPVLTYVSTFSPAPVLNELDRVRLVRGISSDEGDTVPTGTIGTIIAVWPEGPGFEIEFRDFEGLVTAGIEDMNRRQAE